MEIATTRVPRWFVRSDIDGLFGLALDNFIQILLIVNLCQGVLGFPGSLVYGRILPGVAFSLIVGNFYYARLAKEQGKREQRDDITALPYGIDTVSLFAHIFLVMLPVRLAAISSGASSEQAAELAQARRTGGLLWLWFDRICRGLVWFRTSPPCPPCSIAFNFKRYCNHFYCHWFSISDFC